MSAAPRIARLPIGSHRLPHGCKGTSRTKPLHVTVTPKGAVWVCHRCHASGVSSAPGQSRCPQPRPAPEAPPLSAYGLNLWETARPIAGDALEYLKARNCVVPPKTGDLRWLPTLRHPSGYRGPALVALCTDAITGKPRTLHRTWIKPDGTKADVDPPRLLLKDHTKNGAVIRLWPDKSVTHGLGVAEGIETALCVAHGFTPIWSTIDAGNLAALPIMARLEALTIFADYDKAGLFAARACENRWSHVANVTIVKPDKPGTDFADLVAQ